MHYGDTMRQMFVDVYARAYGTFKDPVCYNGDVYAIYYRHLVILKVDVDGDGDLFFQPIINCQLPPNDGIGSKLCHYLLDSLGDLITIYISMGGIRNNEIIDLEIYKLNFESKHWNRVVNNKDRVIFLGSSHSFSCLTDDHDVGGRIFFTRYGDRILYSFNIEDESLTITLPCPNFPNPCNSPYWILPTHDEEEDDDYEDDVEDDDEEEEDDDEELDDGYDYHDEELDEDDAVSISIYNDSKVPKQQAQLSLPSWSIQSRDHTDYILVDPISNKKHFMTIPHHLVHTKIRYSRHGWLLMSNNTSNSMFFYNPFTKDSIKLPDPPRGCISNPTFGFLTTSSSAFSNWVCVGLFSLIPKLMEISYTKSGEEVWHEVSIETDINFVPNNNTPAVLYDEDGHGAFYFLGRHGNLGVLRMENKVKWEVFENPKSPCDCKSYESNFLIECGGELVSVFVGVIGTWVKVFKLNHVLMVWERVNDLGNHMLFIGRYSCSSQLATNPSMVNKIYFPKFSKDDRAIYFSLNTKKFHYSELGAAPAFDSFYSNRIKGPLQSGWIASRFS